MTSPRKSPPAQVVAALGSLRLTVTLLAMSIFLVFVGTLAQVDKGIWTVMEQYFRCWFAWVELKIFFARDANVGGGFPFPGGRLLGAALLVNLLISHASRISVQVRGTRLLAGLGVLAAGMALTLVVILHVFDADSSEKKIDPFWRVSLQLIQGGGAAAVLFVGCWLVFKRKAGIVLLHTGVVVLMLSELTTSLLAKEAQMSIFEGQKINYVEDTRSVELAIVDGSGAATDEVTVVPESKLKQSGLLKIDGLPFDVVTDEKRWMKNASLTPARGGQANPATQGAGARWLAEDRPEASGVDTSGRVDLPAVYVQFKDRATGADLGTWLTAIRLTMEKGAQTLRAGGKDYRISLRFTRTYKPYSLYLVNFRFDRYAGTDTPKDYSSFVKLDDPERGVVRDVRIWMNNPLRYRGDTLYQSSFDAETEKGTVLQVVENRGWMAPYVGCMIVAVGLLGQFQLHLMGFLRKRREAA